MKIAHLLLFIPSIIGLAAVEKSIPPNRSAEEILVLPKVEVPGEFPAEGWLYGRIDHIEIVSHLTSHLTQKLAGDFVIFQQFVRAHYPEASLPENFPVTIVLCKSRNEYQLFAGSTRQQHALVRAANRYFIVDTDALDDPLWIEREIRNQWMEAGYRLHANSHIPLWQEMATKELLVAIEITDKCRIYEGYPLFNPHSDGFKMMAVPNQPSPEIRSPQFLLRLGDQIPLEKLFTLTREKQESERYLHTCSLEAAAFMHQCLFSTRHRKFRQPYRNFVARLASEPYSNQLFQACFDISPQQMDSYLQDYLFGTSIKYETARYKFSDKPLFDLQAAKSAEVLQLFRECERLREVRDQGKR